MHLLDGDSPVVAALNGSERFQLTVTVIGLDTLLASQSASARSYRREDIFVDHEFVDVITDRDGSAEFDLTKLHDTRRIEPDRVI